MHWKVLATGRTGGAEAAFARVKGGGGSGSEGGGWFGMKKGVNRVMAVGFGVLLGVVLAVVTVLGWVDRKGEGGGESQSTKSRASLRGEIVQGAEGGEEVSEERLAELIVEREEVYRNWLQGFGLYPDASFYSMMPVHEWLIVSGKWVETLSVPEIQSLLEEMKFFSGSRSEEYQRFNLCVALFRGWGKKDAAEAFAFLNRYQEGSENLDEWFTKAEERFHTEIFLGWALVDGVNAWKLQESNPEKFSRAIGGPGLDHVKDVFANVVRFDSKEAWRFLLEEEDPWLKKQMAIGIIQGLPAGENWKELAKRIRELELKPNYAAHYPMVASRWFFDDSYAALKWIEEEGDRFIEEIERYEPAKVSPSDEGYSQYEEEMLSLRASSTILSLGQERVVDMLLDDFWRVGLAGQQAVSTWMKEQLPKGEERNERLLESLMFSYSSSDEFEISFAPDISSFDEFLELAWRDGVEGEGPWVLDGRSHFFAPLIEHLPEERSRRYFLIYVELIQPRVEMPSPDERVSSSFVPTFYGPNLALEKAKELMPKIPLTEEERVRVETVFARVEAEEERNRRE